MRCIFCKHEDTNVVDSRLVENNSIKRRRECRECGKRFNTMESATLPSLLVLKKNGTTSLFQREKIFNGIIRAFEKRNCDHNKIIELVDKIEMQIRENYKKEIKSSEIGDIILNNLIDIDEVAYVRFASVYNKFENLDSFIEIVNKLKAEKGK
ncbi:transcriptional regulator NrdR [Oceanivirga salmonicida]|uniref:transcriptional regulator NrdR n=1 Tax=Oceanivirga salmonicida TaxID=1769291 RepID=UPI00082C2C9A|nr:transcriptional regulator NrdR [Oceanivirga salmonicida]